ncbi:MAG TPA: hypothetical protein PLE61_15470 [Vicinamibacterales bacterium]|nr:hypothetical protein [Vicinamibacterales bacterium]
MARRKSITTVHDAKIDSAVMCLQAHLERPDVARADALAQAERIIRRDERFSSAQIRSAFDAAMRRGIITAAERDTMIG